MRVGHRGHHLREEVAASKAKAKATRGGASQDLVTLGGHVTGKPGPVRVLMAQAYFLRFDPKLESAGEPVPPLGALVCAALLRRQGFDVRFFDSMLARDESACIAAMDRERPDVFVLFEDNFNYLTKMCLSRMREAAARLIAAARERGLRVLVAGSDASDDPAFYLLAGAHAVAAGEGDVTVAEWLSAPAGSEAAIPGICTLAHDGEVRRAPSRAPVRDVDALPSPAWEMLDVAAYREVWRRRHAYFALPLAASRGCPFHCNWCAKPIWGQRYNTMTPERAAREVATLKSLGADRVSVLDDIFGLQPGWVEAFGAELRRLDCLLPFKCLSRADLLNARQVKALAEAGCDMVWIGAESGSQKILDAMEKGATVEQIRDAAARLQVAGIRVGLFLQFGYPGETAEDIAATWRLLDDVKPDDIGIAVSYPLPGTRFHERVRHEMTGTHWRDSSDLAMLFQNRGTTFYRALHACTHARFRLGQLRRRGDLGTFERAVRGAWYLMRGAAFRAVMAITARSQRPLPSLPPELTRERAALPSAAEVLPLEARS